MGTSSSFRAPERPRWSAFVAALMSGAPLERIRSELFNAGTDWEVELSTPAVAAFAEAVARLHSELPDRLAQGEDSDSVLNSIIAETRHASTEAGFSAASPLAERALARLLLSTIQGAADDPSAAGERWRSGRGSATELVAKYAGEVLGQYARYVTDREAGRLVSANLGAAASSRLSDDLADRAISIGSSVAGDVLQDTRNISAAWAGIVTRAFEAARALPQDPS